MNKQDLIDAIADRCDLPKRSAEQAINALVDVVMDSVAAGDKVTLVGFGTFEARKRSARQGRNPANGQPISIPASTVPAFSAGKQFKEKVKG